MTSKEKQLALDLLDAIDSMLRYNNVDYIGVHTRMEQRIKDGKPNIEWKIPCYVAYNNLKSEREYLAEWIGRSKAK